MPPFAAALNQSPRALLKDWRIIRLALGVAAKAHPRAEHKPVVFVNFSARLTGLSQNAAFTMLAAMGLQLSGLPVVYYSCNAGLSRCVLGINRDDHLQSPPCARCHAQSQRLFLHAPSEWLTFSRDRVLEKALQDLSIEALSEFTYPFLKCSHSAFECKRSNQKDSDSQYTPAYTPLGKLVLPSLRWALRKHHLQDDESTRYLFRECILSAYNLACKFATFLEQLQPQAVIIFNGIMYPEAVSAWVARWLGYRVITHEVGFEPFSAFFTDGEATAYPIHIPPEFYLSAQQNQQLDAYLEQRFQGNFTMAGIRFWHEMTDLDQTLQQRIAQFKQVVPIFTNVIYDTSQIHANILFTDMFAWLDALLENIRRHSETLFVIRAHPDEMRPGTRKQSRESVCSWVETRKVLSLPNVVFIDSQEHTSSYQLIQRAKVVMVYNSSVGLEATLLGKPVLCAGKARYTQYATVYYPQNKQEFYRMAEELLVDGDVPETFIQNARRFLYYQLFRVSLPFSTFLEKGERPGFVRLRSFKPEQLKAEYSATIRCLYNGVVRGQPYEL